MTLDVIEVPDGAATEMVHRVPPLGSGEFKLGAQVIVARVRQASSSGTGSAYDTFGAGRHTLRP